MTSKFKSDKYRKTRGGYSRFLNVLCEHCGAKILVYQKDGHGPLKRLYFDRIFAPENEATVQNVNLFWPFHMFIRKNSAKRIIFLLVQLLRKLQKYESSFRKTRPKHEAHQSQKENVARLYCPCFRG